MICDHEKTRPPGLPAFGLEHPSGIQPAAGVRTSAPGIDHPAGFFGVGIRAGWRKWPELPQRCRAGGLAKKRSFAQGTNPPAAGSTVGRIRSLDKNSPRAIDLDIFFSTINYWIQLSGTTPLERSRCPKSCQLISWNWAGLSKQRLPDWQPPILSG